MLLGAQLAPWEELVLGGCGGPTKILLLVLLLLLRVEVVELHVEGGFLVLLLASELDLRLEGVEMICRRCC